MGCWGDDLLPESGLAADPASICPVCPGGSIAGQREAMGIDLEFEDATTSDAPAELGPASMVARQREVYAVQPMSVGDREAPGAAGNSVVGIPAAGLAAVPDLSLNCPDVVLDAGSVEWNIVGKKGRRKKKWG